ncbi:MAG: SH3 domain-containing protein [Devosia sp.]
MQKFMLGTAVSVVAGLGLATAAQALDAEATTSVNVRSGPGTGYAVVDTLYAGESVDVEDCRSSGWCHVSHSGPDGWVSSHYLSISDDGSDDGSGQVVIKQNPSVSLSFSFGRGNGFSYGGGPRGNNRDLVCLVTFFKRSQVEAGADVNVQSAQVMTRSQAEAMDRPNDRRAIFDYGTNKQTRDTCRYLDELN